MDVSNRVIVGLIEEVEIYGNNGTNVKVLARIDTGAQNSSISQQLAAELHLGPIIANRMIKQSHGKSLRPIVEVKGNLCGDDFFDKFTISERSHMKYKVLIGQNILRKGFIIDPMKEEPLSAKKIKGVKK